MKRTLATPKRIAQGLHSISPGSTLRRQNESQEELLAGTREKVQEVHNRPLPPIPKLNEALSVPAFASSNASAVSLLPCLARNEEEFFTLVEDGNIAAVQAFLKRQTNFNLNCRNYWGYTALIVAVKHENLDMVNYLLQFESVVLGDAVLHAVLTGNKALVEAILDRKSVHVRSSIFKMEASTEESADFTSDITPLILAAHCDDFEMTNLLLKRGHSIQKPHPPSCFCHEHCRKRIRGESLSASVTRYNKYRAWASPAFIAQSSSDPILTAFMLTQELESCAANEREFKKLYLELASQCRTYAVDLLAECRTTHEVEQLLHRREGDSRSVVDRRAKFARVELAMIYGQSEFLAHYNAQQVMRAAWLEGFHDWRSLNLFTKLARLLPHMLFLPLLALIYMVLPRSRLAQGWRTPLNKFFSFVTSYIIFLCVLSAQAFLNRDNTLRGAPNTGLEWFIILYVTGLAWNNIKQTWSHGIKWYFMYKWNIFDLVTIFTFYCAFACWGCSEYTVSQHPETYHLPRKYWHQFDPMLLGEAFYAWATLFALLRLMFFFQISNTIGPLQVSLSRMVHSIMVFLVLFMLFLLAFAMGLYQIYHHYTDQYKTVDGEVIRQQKTFDSLVNAVHTLYWSLYGYYPPVVANVVVSDRELSINNETVYLPNHHRVTEVAGHTMYAIYYVVAIIILINVLIGMLSHTFSLVQENDDVEWKFARCQVWMRFFQHGSTLPPPINLVPTPKAAIRILFWLGGRISGKMNAKFSCYRCCYLEENEYDMEDDDEQYQALVARLVQRRLTRLERDKVSREPTLSDFDGIKLEIRELQKRLPR